MMVSWSKINWIDSNFESMKRSVKVVRVSCIIRVCKTIIFCYTQMYFNVYVYLFIKFNFVFLNFYLKFNLQILFFWSFSNWKYFDDISSLLVLFNAFIAYQSIIVVIFLKVNLFVIVSKCVELMVFWCIENKKTAIFYDIMRNILLNDAEL